MRRASSDSSSRTGVRARESSVMLPLHPSRHVPRLASFALSLLVVGAALSWSQREVPRPPTIAFDLDADGKLVTPAWPRTLVPIALPPAQPQDKLEARLAAFARHVEAARASVDPPLVAFGAEQLTAEIEAAIARIDDRAQVSVHIRDLDSGRVLFDYYGDTLLNPASNNKLLTSSAALDLLGPDYAFETRVLHVGDALILVGEGDPTIDGDALRLLAAEVAERVSVATVSQIIVDDSAFSPRTLGPGYSEDNWGPSYEAPSGASSLNFNTVEITVYPVRGSSKPAVKLEPDSSHVIVDNRARLAGKTALDIRSHQAGRDANTREDTREGTLTRVEIEGTLARGSRGYRVRRRVVDPGLFTGGAFALMLAEASQSEPLPVHIGVAPQLDEPESGSESQAELDAAASGDGDHQELPRMIGTADGQDITLVAMRRSPPLIDIVGGILTYSNNFMAEQLLRTLGWRMTGDPGDWDNGSEVVRGYWAALGNDPDALVFENGSGLSSVGRVTTIGLVDLMAVAARTHAQGARLIDVLPVAGVAGTLRTRLRRSAKRVRAKTGTLDGVSGLTGVITTEAGEPQVAFSILINVREADRVAADARRGIEDQIVMRVLDHIDGWEATRGTLILDLEPIAVRSGDADD